jgi:glycosyltransferase involved in cell wall biosynthesis
MTPPLVTVIVLFRHDGAVLRRAIEALRQQSLRPFEVVLVDSSSDSSASRFGGDPKDGPWQRFVVVEAPDGLTPGAARNRGIDASRGSFIAFLAADCVPARDWLQRRLDRHLDGFEAVAGSVECATPRGPWQVLQWLVRFGGAYPSARPRTDSVPRFGWSYARHLLEERFPEDLPASEDRVLNERLLAAGVRVIFDPGVRLGHVGLTSFSEVLAHQRHHGTAAARLLCDNRTRRFMARYARPGVRWWYPPLRWIRGLSSAASAGTATLAAYVALFPWQLAAHAAWADGFRREQRRIEPSPSRERMWIVDEFGRGGIARYAVDVANLLRGRSEVIVATTSDGPAPGLKSPGSSDVWFPRRSDHAADGIRAGFVGLTRAVWRTRRGDRAWIPLGIRPVFEGILSVVLRVGGVRTVCTIHNRAPHGRKARSRLVEWTARGCDMRIVHNAAMVEWARSRGLDVATLPFPVPDVGHSGPARVFSRRSLHLRDDDLVLLSFGNLRPYKGVDVLLHGLALAAAREGTLPVKLVLAGRQQNVLDPVAVARAWNVEDRVRVVPRYLEDGELCDLLGLADAAAFPYRRIDHSGSAVLAAASGLPAIASDLAPLREAFKDRAIYVEPGDPDALADALLRLPGLIARVGKAAAADEVGSAFESFAVRLTAL